MKYFPFIFLSALFSYFSFAENLGLSELDSAYENKLHSIYKQYHSKSISPTRWKSLNVNRSVNTYSVSSGDNLWDISKVLFGDSDYWPKLWSVNSYIKNPHRIEKGMKLRVVMGDEETAPSGLVHNAQDDSYNSEQEIVVEVDADTELAPTVSSSKDSRYVCSDQIVDIFDRTGIVSIYESEFKCKSQQLKIAERRQIDRGKIESYLNTKNGSSIQLPNVIKYKSGGVIPASLPPIQLVPSEEEKFRMTGMSSNMTTSHQNILTHYILDRRPSSVGGIEQILDEIGITTSSVIISSDDVLEKGSKVTVIKPSDSVRSSNLLDLLSGGYEVVVQAELEVLYPIQGESGEYMARVTQSFSSFSTNSILISGSPIRFNYRSVGRLGDVQADIIGNGLDGFSHFLTIHSFLYVDKGAQQGIRVGDLFKIRNNPSVHDTSVEASIDVGEAIVVHVSDKVATAFVTQMNSVAKVGDYLSPAVWTPALTQEILKEEEVEEKPPVAIEQDLDFTLEEPTEEPTESLSLDELDESLLQEEELTKESPNLETLPAPQKEEEDSGEDDFFLDEDEFA